MKVLILYGIKLVFLNFNFSILECFLSRLFPVDNEKRNVFDWDPIHPHFLEYAVTLVTQPVCTCSKSAMETVEQGVKYIQSYQ